MEIPKTTKEMPYIQFIIYTNGEIVLSASANWWGGKNGGFTSRDGRGNSCLPKHLESYIKHEKQKEIKEIKKEIKNLQNKLLKLLK